MFNTMAAKITRPMARGIALSIVLQFTIGILSNNIFVEANQMLILSAAMSIVTGEA